MMTYKLIHTENYLLAVDDLEIKEGDLYVTNGQVIKHDGRHEKGQGLKPIAWFGGKIIAHRPLNNAAFLEGVDVLPLLEQEDDAEKLARETIVGIEFQTGFIEGYNKAREKYKYTEEDVKKAIFLYSAWITGGTPSLRVAETAEERQEQIIKSLSQPKIPVGFECVMEYRDMVGYWYKLDEHSQSAVDRFGCETRIRTITNSEGRTEWVGRYVY